MKKNIRIILIVSLLLFVTGCSEKQYSVTIKEYYDLKVDDFSEMVISTTEVQNISFDREDSIDLYERIIEVESTNTYTPTEEDLGLKSLNYKVVINLKDSMFIMSIGDDYISITEDPLSDVDSVTTIHMASESYILEVERLINEIIKGKKITIQGSEYDIVNTIIETYEYDSMGNLTSSISKHDDVSYRVEYTYDDDLLIRIDNFADGQLVDYLKYYFEDKKMIRYEIFGESLIGYTEYEYLANEKIIRDYNENDDLLRLATAKLDEKGNVISREQETDMPSEVGITRTDYTYVSDQIKSNITYVNDEKKSETHFEYNDFNDQTVSYTLIYTNDKVRLTAFFSEYVYNSDKLPIKRTTYMVNSDISEENIPNFE